jgi:hypothetical protein
MALCESICFQNDSGYARKRHISVKNTAEVLANILELSDESLTHCGRCAIIEDLLGTAVRRWSPTIVSLRENNLYRQSVLGIDLVFRH